MYLMSKVFSMSHFDKYILLLVFLCKDETSLQFYCFIRTARSKVNGTASKKGVKLQCKEKNCSMESLCT